MKNLSRKTLLITMALFIALDATVTVGMLQSTDRLDITFGKGEQRIINMENGETVNTQYYTVRYATQADALAAAQLVSRQISDEGTVLLKNDGLLPLSADTHISPLGIGCFVPLYCGTGSSVISTLDSDVVSPLEGLHEVFPNINEQLEEAQRKAWEAEKLLS